MGGADYSVELCSIRSKKQVPRANTALGMTILGGVLAGTGPSKLRVNMSACATGEVIWDIRNWI
jgi:hypothetical protein